MADHPPSTKPPRHTGLAHFLAASRYSLAGLRRLWRESAFRQEATIGLAILIPTLIFLPFVRALGLMLLLLLLVAVEALNTAIETLVDHLSPEWSEFARDAKDLGSLAVGCIVVATAIYLGWAILG